MVDTRRQYDSLASLYLPIAVGVFVLVVLLVLALVVRYRIRAPDARAPSRLASAPRVEALYVLALLAVAAFLMAALLHADAKTDRALGARGDGPRIAVVAAKWRWRFTYPAAHAIVQQGARPQLVVPAGVPVRFTLVSIDVIHSFWIPSLAFKRAAYPQVIQRFTLTFPHPGFWRAGGECAEYCGLYHDQMRFDVRVLAPAAFAAWERARGGAA